MLYNYSSVSDLLCIKSPNLTPLDLIIFFSNVGNLSRVSEASDKTMINVKVKSYSEGPCSGIFSKLRGQ